ncbi:hypothetical protein SME05J_24160 [Serratia marcescens]|nr:hypothetical protein SME05J_24160 [Serratia marcescens]BEM78303.1 hypothetical protein SME38J_24060 [Serratia marcescens]
MPLTFKPSKRLSIGTEKELQLVDDEHYDLTDRAGIRCLHP